MEFLVNPNLAYLLTVTAVMLFVLTAIAPKSILLKVGMVLCLGAALYEFSQLQGNIWALLVVAISPLPFFAAIRQTRSQPYLAILTIIMLTLGSVFLIGDAKGGGPRINYSLAGIVSIFCGSAIWIIFLRMRDARGVRLGDNPDSMVGLIGTARTAIEKYSTGSVEIEGEVWVARSEEPVEAGSMIRIVRYDGLVLTVEKVEKLTR